MGLANGSTAAKMQLMAEAQAQVAQQTAQARVQQQSAVAGNTQISGGWRDPQAQLVAPLPPDDSRLGHGGPGYRSSETEEKPAKKCWHLRRKIGSGSFGEIFCGIAWEFRRRRIEEEAGLEDVAPLHSR